MPLSQNPGKPGHKDVFARARAPLRAGSGWSLFCMLALLYCAVALAQSAPDAPVRSHAAAPGEVARRRASHFLQGRTFYAAAAAARTPAEALGSARAQHLAVSAASPVRTSSLVVRSASRDAAASLTAPWQAVGPLQVQTAAYGLVTGRITSVVIDPNDVTGNTVYVGTSGGGVWKSANAAGPAQDVSFTPLTDTLPVFSADAGGSVVPSLSIGALAVQPGGGGVVLAGTGDPNDAADSYYGAGILRSADSGLTWSLVQGGSGGSFVGEGIAAFAWSTVSPQVVVVAVSSAAEAAIVQDSRFPGVRGLYYSQDGGETWTVATLQDGSNVIQSQFTDFRAYRGNAATAVVWNPLRRRFYAAVRSHGYYESADGVTWTRLLNQPGTGLTSANCPTRSGDYGLTSCPVFRGALAVQPVSGDLFALTVDATNRDGGLWQDACALSGGACASGSVLWGNRLDATAMEDAGRIDGGDYNLTLAAVPAATALSVNDTLLFAGTTDLFRCGLSGGCSLRNTTNTTNGCAAPAGVAPAQHAIAWQPNLSNTSTPRMFFGNDGGLWRSLDGVRQQAAVCSADDANHFENLNGGLGSLAEVTGFSSHPIDANVLLAALGANGSAASISASQAGGTAAWAQLSDGESGTVAIDQTNGQTWLVQSGAGVSLHACTAGTSCTAADFSGPAVVGSAQVQGDDSLVDAPALLDPGWNTNVIVGTCRVYRGPASGGSAWSSSSAISRFLAGPASPACNGSDASLRSLAAGGAAVLTNGSQNSGSPVLYAGLAGAADGGSAFAGQIFVNTSADTATSSTAWTNAALSPVTNDATGFNRGGFDVSSLAVDPSDATGRTVYATIMGFGYPHLYRSTDAGGTWTNISSNLPDAPANSVVVDPDDPLVVYVALDTGVYATTDVTSCVSAATGVTGSCWGVLGSALPNAPVLTLVASKSLSGGVLRAGTFGRGIWQLPLLSAGQSLSAVASFSTSSLVFAAQLVGSTSAVQTVTLTNTGNTALQISAVSAGTGFLETDTCGGASLTVNGSCTIHVSFAPTTGGAIGGSLLVYGNLSGGYAALPLSGMGQGVASLQFLPAALSFVTTSVGSTSPTRTVTLTNSGTGPAVPSSPLASPDFVVTASTCGGTLGAGNNCIVTLAFVPSQVGPEIGTLSMDSGSMSYTVALSGSGAGLPHIVLSPASLYFGQVAVNGHLGSAVVTIANDGNAVWPVGAMLASGDFSVYQSGCPLLMSPGQSCTVVLAFGATAPGRRTGVFTLVDALGTYTVDLAGDGLATTVDFSPPALVFGSIDVGGTSAVQTITVTNHAGNTLAWGVLAAAGDFGITSNTCVDKLEPRQSCTISVNFAPTTDGLRYGNLTLDDQFTPHTILLSGAGRGTARVAISAASLGFGSIAVNSTSPAQALTVTNKGTAPIALSSTTVTGDFLAAANTCGSTLAAGASCALSIEFTPRAEGLRSGTLTIMDALGPHVVALSGTGSGQAVVTLSPAALTFPQTAVHSVSAAFDVTVSNSGTSAASLGLPTVTGDFSVTGSTCNGALAAGAQCSLSISFLPSAAGLRSGVLTLSDSVASHTVSLNGNGLGQPAATISPGSLTFPQTAVHGTSAAQTVTVSNGGTTAAALQSPIVTGDFTLASSTCGGSLGAGGICVIAVDFTPQVEGVRTGTLTVTDAVGAHTVALSGTGFGQSLVVVSPVALIFPQTAVHGTSAVQTVTVSNSGTSDANLQSPVITGDFALISNACGSTLAAGASCSVTIDFTPQAEGLRRGTLTVTDGAGAHTVGLGGVGLGQSVVVVSAAALVFPETAVHGTSLPQSVTVSNSGTSAAALQIPVVTGAFVLASSTCGSVLAAGGSCVLALTFTPQVEGAATGSLTLTDGVGAHAIALSGTGLGETFLVLSPVFLSFPQTVVGVGSLSRSIAVANVGSSVAALGAVSVTGDFAVTANTCGRTLPSGGTCSLSVTFTPVGAGTRFGVLSLPEPTSNHTVALTGNGTTGLLTVTPVGLSFADVSIGSTSSPKVLTLSNTGSAVLRILGVGVAGDYAGSGSCVDAALAAGGSCTVSVTFSPTAVGARAGTLTVTSDSAGNAVTIVPLGGNGVGAYNVVLTPSAIDFGTQLTGTSSAVRNITISNTGNVSGGLGSVRISGDFSLGANTCGTSLPAQTGCTVSIVFTPTAGGTRTGLLTVVDDAGTQTATLVGVGASAATDAISPLAVSFPTQVVNTTGATQSVTLTNSGDVALTLVTARILAGDFTAVNGCGPTLPARSSCSITVGFAPKSVGLLTGTLQVTDVQRNQAVSLSGAAIAGAGVSLLPSSLTFANTGVGVVGAGQSLTLTNHGGSPLTVSAVNVAGDFGIVAGTGTCVLGATMAPGSSCAVQVAFLPTAAGQRAGSITVTSDAPTQTSQLAGVGVDFQLVPNGNTSVTLSSGGSAVFPLLLRPLVTTFDPVVYTCTGAPANAKCSVTSQYGDLSAVQTVTVTILTGTTAKRISVGWLLLGLAPLCLRRRARRGLLAVLLLTASLAGMNGCGSNRVIALSGSGDAGGGGGTTAVTPVGTYNILASATAAGVTHSVSLTLIVK